MTQKQSFKLQKLVVSMGLGNRSFSQIQKVKQHFQKIFASVLGEEKPQKATITKCVKSNAKFKIRKGNPCGLKITLRKKRLIGMLMLMRKYFEMESFNPNNNTFSFGIKDHRLLRLERYNYQAPEYGFSIHLVSSPICNRVYNRRINRNKSSTSVISKENFKQLIQNAFKQ